MNQPAAFAGEITVQEIPLDLIFPDASQVRRHFDDEALQQLADSIREHRVIQPIVVRPVDATGVAPYELIAGERRWRASKLAGRETIPAVIRADLVGQDVSVLQILENLQRADLNLHETAAGVAALVAKVGNAQAAQQLGKSEGWVSKHARVGELPETVKTLISEGKVTSADMAHDMAQVIHIRPPEHWAVERMLEDAAEGMLTRSELRQQLKNAKEQAEREARWERERQEQEAAEAALANDPEHQQRAAAAAEAARQRQETWDRERQLLAERSEAIDALNDAAEPICIQWMRQISETCGLTVPRDEEGEVVLQDDYDACSEECWIQPDYIAAHGDEPIPESIDGLRYTISITAAHGLMERIVTLLTGSDPEEKQGDLYVGTFIAERLDRTDAAAREKAADVHAAYVQWCEARGFEPLPLNGGVTNAWGEAIAAAGIEKIRSNGIRYVGVRLI